MAKINLKTTPVKDKVKDTKDWKSISSTDKDELLFELCKRAMLIPHTMPYEDIKQ